MIPAFSSHSLPSSLVMRWARSQPSLRPQLGRRPGCFLVAPVSGVFAEGAVCDQYVVLLAWQQRQDGLLHYTDVDGVMTGPRSVLEFTGRCVAGDGSEKGG